jgi:hypothetical protein
MKGLSMFVHRILPSLLVLAMGVAAPAQDKESSKSEKPEPKQKLPSADPKAKPPSTKPPSTINRGERQLRLHLMDGSVVSGKLSMSSFTVDTEFGKLEIPVSRVVRFTPGLDSHPKQRQHINTLILQLGANTAELRDTAQKELSGMGIAVKPLLEPYRDDKDPERKKRIAEMLEEFEQAAEEEEPGQDKRAQLINADSIETPQFTVVGKISPQSFQVQLQYGSITVSLNDIRRGEEESEEKPELRRNIVVAGDNLVLVNYKNTGIRVNRGDKIEVDASGRIIMTPWGSDASADPDGTAQYGVYKAGINTGALVARIGGSGSPEFKVGKSLKFTAQKSGTLHFAIAMQAQFANQNYRFPGEYKVKVKVNPQ